MRSRLGRVAPSFVLLLVLAGCGGGDEEKSTDEATSQATTAAEVPAQCELLDEAELTELAGAALEHPSASYLGDLPESACTWRDSMLTDYTVEIFMTGASAGTWARELDSTLNGSLTSENLQELIDSEDLRAKLTDEQACGLWDDVAEFSLATPEDDVAFDTFQGEGDDDRYVSRAEICRDGMYAELTMTSTEVIPEARAVLVKKQVETVWQRARDLAPAEGA